MARDRKVFLEQDASAIEDGDWVNTDGLDEIVLHVFGLVSGDIVQVEGSNEEGTPSNPVQIGSDITEDDIVKLDAVPLQVRVNVTDNSGGGTVTAVSDAPNK